MSSLRVGVKLTIDVWRHGGNGEKSRTYIDVRACARCMWRASGRHRKCIRLHMRGHHGRYQWRDSVARCMPVSVAYHTHASWRDARPVSGGRERHCTAVVSGQQNKPLQWPFVPPPCTSRHPSYQPFTHPLSLSLSLVSTSDYLTLKLMWRRCDVLAAELWKVKAPVLMWTCTSQNHRAHTDIGLIGLYTVYSKWLQLGCDTDF